jgi:hypothetical protein
VSIWKFVYLEWRSSHAYRHCIIELKKQVFPKFFRPNAYNLYGSFDIVYYSLAIVSIFSFFYLSMILYCSFIDSFFSFLGLVYTLYSWLDAFYPIFYAYFWIFSNISINFYFLFPSLISSSCSPTLTLHWKQKTTP